jgi:transcription elongation factor Elf1
MAMMPSMSSTDYQMTCAKCGETLFVPDWFERMSDGKVHYLWCCTNCGNKFETAVESPVDADPKIEWEQMFPALLVG